MSQKVLAQVQLWTIFLALPLAIGLGFAVSSDFGVGVFLTALWAVAGLRALEGLIRTGLMPKGTPKNPFEIILWVLAKIAVYAVAVWVLFTRPLPPTSHFVGFTLMMLVLVIVGARNRAQEIRRES
ncbi:MAG: hypothetical protein ACI9UK_002223 [Candidatus Krumholzibacteriia bacterium]